MCRQKKIIHEISFLQASRPLPRKHINQIEKNPWRNISPIVARRRPEEFFSFEKIAIKGWYSRSFNRIGFDKARPLHISRGDLAQRKQEVFGQRRRAPRQCTRMQHFYRSITHCRRQLFVDCEGFLITPWSFEMWKKRKKWKCVRSRRLNTHSEFSFRFFLHIFGFFLCRGQSVNWFSSHSSVNNVALLTFSRPLSAEVPVPGSMKDFAAGKFSRGAKTGSRV